MRNRTVWILLVVVILVTLALAWGGGGWLWTKVLELHGVKPHRTTRLAPVLALPTWSAYLPTAETAARPVVHGQQVAARRATSAASRRAKERPAAT